MSRHTGSTSSTERLALSGAQGLIFNEMRAKTKVIQEPLGLNPKDYPDWSFDGSSTGQAEGNNSDCILKYGSSSAPSSSQYVTGQLDDMLNTSFMAAHTHIAHTCNNDVYKYSETFASTHDVQYTTMQ